MTDELQELRDRVQARLQQVEATMAKREANLAYATETLRMAENNARNLWPWRWLRWQRQDREVRRRQAEFWRRDKEITNEYNERETP